MIETVLETQPITYGSNNTGTITVTSGSTAVAGVGTLFTSELVAGNVISYLDDASVFRSGIVDSVTDNTNLVLKSVAPSTASGVAYVEPSHSSPFFIVDDPSNEGLPNNRIYNVLAANPIFKGPNGESLISHNEGVLIKSIYARLPYQFTLAATDLEVNMIADITGQGQESIPELGTNGDLYIPIENIEVDVNQFIPPPDTAVSNDATWQLRMLIQNSGGTNPDAAVSNHNAGIAAVSNINVPSILTFQPLPVIFGVRIVHGLALTVPA